MDTPRGKLSLHKNVKVMQGSTLRLTEVPVKIGHLCHRPSLTTQFQNDLPTSYLSQPQLVANIGGK